jgi:flagellar motor switch protein FliM
MAKLSTKLWFSLIEKGSTDESRQAIEHKVEETKIPISAILGRSMLSVHDFLMLQQGDVLPLNTDVDGKIELIVGNMLKYYGKPGARNKKVAVKITDIIHEEEN